MRIARSFSMLLSALVSLIGSTTDLQAESSKPLLKTKAENTAWSETGRYEEVERLCPAFAKAYPHLVRCFSFGKSPEGRPLLAMAIGEKSYLQPSLAKSRKRPVVFFQGGIHAGEIDGKDAGFWFVRDILEAKILPGILQRVSLVFVPVFNVDGHERFGANGRPNQVGPKEMGWRTTSQNYNLNRDYLKADAPEMRAMLGLLHEWDPLLLIDLHVTDGAKFQHDIALMIEPGVAGPEAIVKEAAVLRDKAMADLTAAGHLPLWFYPSFITQDVPTSGIRNTPVPPRFANGYWAASNRIGVLVETHSWRPYAHRVRSTYEALKTLVASAGTSGASWRKAADAADEESKRWVGKPWAVTYESTAKSSRIDFLGYAYTRTMSAVSGQLMTRYDDETKETWQLPFFPEVEPTVFISAPDAYIIPPAYREIFEERLKLHRIHYEVLKSAWQGKAEAYRLKVLGPVKPFNESHSKPDYDGAWENINGLALAGSLKVPVAQASSKLAMLLLDPSSPDSMLAWGYLNQIFERKEYMEAYVTEEQALTMLKDPAIKQEFDDRLKDPEFAKDPEKRLDFFAARHPSYDQAYLVYPVLRIRP